MRARGTVKVVQLRALVSLLLPIRAVGRRAGREMTRLGQIIGVRELEIGRERGPQKASPQLRRRHDNRRGLLSNTVMIQ